MMASTAGMLEALEKYYGQKYTKVVRSAIITAIGKSRERKYLLDVYQGVIETYSSTFKTLPDLAIIEKVRRTLGSPDTYRQDAGLPALPEPVSPQMEDAIKAAIARIGAGGVGNQQEIDRVKGKAAAGDASLYELWWLRCIESKEPYKAMPERFIAEHEGVKQW